MKIYKMWIIENIIFVKEHSCVEKKNTYLINDFYYINKNELNKLYEGDEFMFSLTCDEEAINLFKKLLKEKYSKEIKQIREKIKSLENGNTNIEYLTTRSSEIKKIYEVKYKK